MNRILDILNLAKQNNGVITSKMVSDAGFSRGSLKYLCDKALLERTSRGVYALPDTWEDEFLSIQARYKKGIFAIETALYLNQLTDRTPHKFSLFFPKTYNLTNPKKDSLKCFNISGEEYSSGIVKLITPSGNEVYAYGPEKTLCDILRPRFHVDIQIISDAYKQYMRSQNSNISLLSEYAKMFHVESKVRSYLEVLL